MKIRVRLSLLFILCSTASLLVCGFLLLRASAKSTIRSAEDNAVSELEMLKTSFSSAASKNLDAGASDAVRRSLLVYIFQSYADDTFSGSQYILRRGEDTLYNNSGYAPEVLLDGLERNTVTWQGEKLFAAGTDMDLLRETYQIYLIRNLPASPAVRAHLRRGRAPQRRPHPVGHLPHAPPSENPGTGGRRHGEGGLQSTHPRIRQGL